MRNLFTLFLLLSVSLNMLGVDFTYDGINYTILNETQKICMTKAGEIEDNWYDSMDPFLTPGNEIEGNIEIPSKVMYAGKEYTVGVIGSCSFALNKISSVKLPETITEIGSYAFTGCENLSSINFPNSLKNIQNFAFKDCISLTQAYISDSVTETGTGVFMGCKSLSDVKLSNSLTYLSHLIFYNCISLPHISIPKSITSLGTGGYDGSGECFRGCINLKSVDIHDSLTYIGWGVFQDCTSLLSLYIPDSVTTIMYSAFAGCTSLKNIRLPKNLTTIFNGLFARCQELENIEIPEKVTSIGMGAFEECSSLTNITLPAAVKDVLTEAFKNCSSLSDFYCYSKTPPTCESNVFANMFLSYVTLHVPVGCKNSYSSANGWQSFGEIVDDLTAPSGNEEIFDSGNFKYKIIDKDSKTVSLIGFNSSKEEQKGDLYISSTVSYGNNTYSIISIGNYAFYNAGINSIEINPSIVSIGGWAFANCTSLKTVKLPEFVLEISEGLFSGCSSLEKIYFSADVNSIGTAAFSNCGNLRSFTIPDGVTEIPMEMLSNCFSLSEILIPNSVTAINEKAFQGCTALKNIDLGTGVYYIGNYAFADCPNIQNIHSMALNPPYADAYTFPTDSYTNAVVTVQEQALATYNSQNPWYRFQNYLTVTGAISLSHYNVDMAGNEVFQLGIYGSDSKIEWTSSNPSVAYANDCGLIVAMGITGATVITANVDGEQINCNVTVSSPYRDPNVNTRASEEEETQPVDVIIESISGNPPMVNARLVPVGSKTIIDWTSSNSNIASVENGIVTVYSDGDVNFGVETENGLEETIEVDTKNIDEAGIETILGDSDIIRPMNVYDLTGRTIYLNATFEQIKNLEKGLYIIKGKKVLVK